MARPVKPEENLAVPITMRITQRQMSRMQRLATVDGLNQQEHMRRALDIYLNGMEKTYQLPLLPFPQETE